MHTPVETIEMREVAQCEPAPHRERIEQAILDFAARGVSRILAAKLRGIPPPPAALGATMHLSLR